jgi:aspartate racemase
MSAAGAAELDRAARRRLKTLGVLGGMGPAATADFIAKMIERTSAGRDDEHVPCVVINEPRIPDRTDAFRSGREAEVLDALTAVLRRLENAGVDGFVMPCNSAHHWAEALAARTRTPMLHIADASLDAVQRLLPEARRVAIMGTPVTVQSGFYQRRMRMRGLEHHAVAESLLEEMILPGIRSVKAGDLCAATTLLRAASEQILNSGAEAILLACTEIPLALSAESGGALVDTNAALADACVAWSHSSD